MSEGCPLGYECDKLETCTRLGIGIDEPMATEASERGLVVDTAEFDGETVPMLELCAGPLRFGFNAQAETARALHPELAGNGLERAIRATEAMIDYSERQALFSGIETV